MDALTGAQVRTYCIPARGQAPFTSCDWLDEGRRRTVVSEYVKLAWFLMYGVFT